jgi:hypothetical protein
VEYSSLLEENKKRPFVLIACKDCFRPSCIVDAYSTAKKKLEMVSRTVLVSREH